MEKILFRVNGGLGKNICATAVLKQIKNKFPSAIIHVQASHPDVFVNLPEVDEIYPYQSLPNFYKYHKDFEILECEPYIDLAYRSGKDHIISTWCRRLNLNSPDHNKGIIILDECEKATAAKMLEGLKFQGQLIALQYVGGTPFTNAEMANDLTRPKQVRDLPFEIAQEIVNRLVNHGFGVLQISLPTERKLEKVFSLPDNQILNPRYLFAILNKCHSGVFIDSFCQHAWVALGKENAVVLWGGTNPNSLGYNVNINLSNEKSCDNLFCNRPDTFMMDIQGNGMPWKCPYGNKCMKFDPEMVVHTLISSLKK